MNANSSQSFSNFADMTIKSHAEGFITTLEMINLLQNRLATIAHENDMSADLLLNPFESCLKLDIGLFLSNFSTNHEDLEP